MERRSSRLSDAKFDSRRSITGKHASPERQGGVSAEDDEAARTARRSRATARSVETEVGSALSHAIALCHHTRSERHGEGNTGLAPAKHTKDIVIVGLVCEKTNNIDEP